MPLTPAWAPHTHVYGDEILAPRRNEEARRNSSCVNFSLRVDDGRVLIQSLDPRHFAPCNRTFSCSVETFSSSLRRFSAIYSYHFFCSY